MNTASCKIKFHAQDNVPVEGRAAWLERFGVPPEFVEVDVFATFQALESIKELLPNGSVGENFISGTYYGIASVSSLARRNVFRWFKNEFVKTGKISSPIDITDLIAESVKEHEEEKERFKRENMEREERHAKDVLENKERELAAEEEKESWIQEHGSARLKRMYEEEIECEAVYQDERLAIELPGWYWYANVPGKVLEPRNVPEEAFAVLDEARKILPEAELKYYVETGEEDDDDLGVRVYVAYFNGFLGRSVVFGVPRIN